MAENKNYSNTNHISKLLILSFLEDTRMLASILKLANVLLNDGACC